MTNQIFLHYTGKRILVTGASGYIATNLIHLLKDINCTVIRLSRHSNLLPMSGIAKVMDITGDICKKEIWKEVLEDVDIVYHFAAQTSGGVADQNPFVDLEINVIPMLNLLETCRQQGWRPIVLFSSTVTVAGIPTRLPVDETQPDIPITVYDLHKLMAEQYLKYYVNQNIVRGAVLRLANVYGPGPKSSRSDRGILNQMTRRALVGESLTVYGRGDQLRDYVYVEDVAGAFLEAGRMIDRLNSKHFVIGSGQGYTIAQAMNLVSERVSLKTGSRVPVIHIDPPSPQLPIESRNFVADSSQFSQATGWRSRYSLTEGIDRTIEVLS